MRIVVLIEQVGPYHAARLRALAAMAGFEQCCALVVANASRRYAWAKSGDLGFKQRLLFESAHYEDLCRRELTAALSAALDELDPECLAVNGWGFVEARVAIRWAVRRQRRVVMMADSQPPGQSRRRWRELAKRLFVAGCGAAFVAGSRHAAYLEQLGMPSESIVRGYDVVDNDHFERAIGMRGRQEGDRRTFLCCARIIPEKNVRGLIAEYESYVVRQGPRSWDLVIAGDGPLRGEAEADILRRGLGARIKLAGNVPYEELPRLYAAASALVLPSVSDTWGLVVNEAMAAGLPVLVSRACGCAPDLVLEGENGWTFDPGREGDLALALARTSESDGSAREEMGRVGRSLIRGYTPRTWAESLMHAFELAEGLQPRFPWGLLRLVP